MEKTEYNRFNKFSTGNWDIRFYRISWQIPVGSQANEAAFYVIQHSQLKYQKKFLTMMKTAANKKDLPWCDVAKMIDRIAIAEGKKQVYGTQMIPKKDPKTGYITNDIEFAPIQNPRFVNKRRQHVGLKAIEEQATEFGIVYKK